MKKNVIAVLLGLLAGSAMAAPVAEVSHKDVAGAMQEVLKTEAAQYDKFVSLRVKAGVINCPVGAVSDANTLANTTYFQTTVKEAYKSLDGGKYAVALDPDLASKPGALPAAFTSEALRAYVDVSRTTYKTLVDRVSASKCAKVDESWAEEHALPTAEQFTFYTMRDLLQSKNQLAREDMQRLLIRLPLAK